MFFIVKHREVNEIPSPQGCGIPNRKAELCPKFGTTHPKELLFHKKVFAVISINSGNNISR